MKGLLIKEFGIMKTQKVFFIIIGALVLFFVFSNDLSFALGYLSFAMPVFSITTISYDEFDNGYAFLFTLPITRKQYVIEKYLFGAILGALSMVISCALAFVMGLMGDMSQSLEALKALPAITGIMLIALSVIIPIQIKFGAEKGRNVMLVITGMVVAIGFFADKLINAEFLVKLLNKIQQLSLLSISVIAVLIVLMVVFVSIKASVAIINKKEF